MARPISLFPTQELGFTKLVNYMDSCCACTPSCPQASICTQWLDSMIEVKTKFYVREYPSLIQQLDIIKSGIMPTQGRML